MAGLLQTLDRTGHFSQQPATWVALAAGIAAAGGARGRHAAARGVACYFGAAAVSNLVLKPLVRRPRPPEARQRGIGPVTTSFPSGHAASDLAFVFGVAQVMPALFVPLAGASLTADWSLVRSRGHYASDVLLGGALGIAVAVAIRKVWPVPRPDDVYVPAAGGPGGDTDRS